MLKQRFIGATVAMARLDPTQINTLRDLMGDDFDALIDAFRADSPGQIDAIVHAARHNDPDGLRLQAHSLKGACSNLGAFELGAVCGRIEAFARQHDCVMAQALIAELYAEYGAVDLELDGLSHH